MVAHGRLLERPLGVLLVFLSLASVAHAQEFGRLEQIETNAPLYYFLRPGEATTRVYLWGSIPAPGYYEVGPGVTLEQLLTLSGGPLIPTESQGSRVETTVRLYRQQDGARALLYERGLVEFLQRPADAPDLVDGDVVVVESVTNEVFNWRDALTITTAVLALAIAVDRLASGQ